ncbi:hypothetical protein F4780DRAFT_345287 [Xylariomycetidae sp. FL0641]|nr:hypothetical protein F4780DRAFT_345287 [Xylariomycetidae sp. FL0641]
MVTVGLHRDQLSQRRRHLRERKCRIHIVLDEPTILLLYNGDLVLIPYICHSRPGDTSDSSRHFHRSRVHAPRTAQLACLPVRRQHPSAACVSSIALIGMILWKYVDSKDLWKKITTGPLRAGSSSSWENWLRKGLGSRNSGSSNARALRPRDHVTQPRRDPNWLVLHLSIAIVCVS